MFISNSILPILWYTFKDYVTGSTTVKNIGTLGSACDGTLRGTSLTTFPIHVKTLGTSLISAQSTCLSLIGMFNQCVSIPTFFLVVGISLFVFGNIHYQVLISLLEYLFSESANTVLIHLSGNILNFIKGDNTQVTAQQMMSTTSNNNTWCYISVVYNSAPTS